MELLDTFKLPMTLTSYNNAGDPTVYVTMFKFLMQLNSATDPLLCRAFPIFLEGSTLLWFSNLPKDSIHDFE